MAFSKLVFLAAIIALCSSEEIFSERNSSRISGAEWASQGQFPYHVSIVSTSPQTGQRTLCSGSVLGTSTVRWVFTSASCALQSTSYEIRTDSVNFYTGGWVVNSRESHVHPNYNPITRANNIALIRAPGLSGKVIPLMPSRWNLDLTRRQAVVAGWGLNPTNEVSPVLQFARGFILNSDETGCKHNFNNIAQNNNDRLCAQFNGQRACTGDTGSAMVVEENRVDYLVGIATFTARDGACTRSTSLFSGITPETRQWLFAVTGIQYT